MLTVLFASYNGARTLPRMLEAFRRLQAPPGGWRVVAVDNGSTDETANIIRGYVDTLPLTYVHEGRRGKNAALNTGLKHLDGDLVVLTDDDILPSADWLVRLREAADAHPDFAVLCGNIVPCWERPPEPWILDWVPQASTYALTAPGVADGEVDPSSVWGPNMAVRAEVFAAGYRFDETVGPKGTDYAMGSETSFVRKLAAAGMRSWFCKAAEVQHIVRDFQMEKSWVLARATRFGRGQIRKQLLINGSRPATMLGVPRYLLRELAEATARTAVTAILSEPKAAFQARWRLNYVRGQITEARRIARDDA